MFRHLVQSLAWGLPIALAWGVLEACWYWWFGAAEVVGGSRLVSSSVVIYLILGVMAALPMGFLFGLLEKFRKQPKSSPAFYCSLWFSLFVVLGVGLWLNQNWLGGSLDTMSLVVDAVLLLFGWPLLFRFFHSLISSRFPNPEGGGSFGFKATAIFLGLGLLGMLGPNPTKGAATPARTIAKEAPNVLFLLIDTLRADHLSCYGYERPTSPRLDQLSQKGVLFEECISQAPHTKPSTASILTSLYPPTHQVEHFTSSLPDEANTLHEILHEAGWRTALMSANTFLSPTYGFGSGVERFRGSIVNPAFQLAGSEVFHRLRRIFVKDLHFWRTPWDFLRSLAFWPFMPQGNPYQHGMTAGQINSEFLTWMDDVQEDPWFGYLQYMEPHAPYEPAKEHQLFNNPPSPDGVWFPSGKETLFLPFVSGPQPKEGELENLLANYDACIHEVDARIGELLDELEERGELENTLVVVTSDHGEEFFDHGGWGHGHSLHRELIHVPLILSWPGHLPEGVRVSSQVRSVDILPTLLALLDVSSPSNISGASLPLEDEPSPREGFSEVHWGGHWARSMRGASGTLLHAVFQGEDSERFYLPTDPTEQNVVDSSSEEAQRLAESLEDAHARFSANAMTASEAAVDDATKEALSHLGYSDDDE
ncbi:MAG: sulfatase [Planctomycetota bacterium]|jgi:arylsulfatase A-like enzyme|nr:sulfatase [Planctomycetota bacterium]